MYSVDVDFAPAYELIVSLVAYRANKEHKTLALGPAWAAQVRDRLPAPVVPDIDAADGMSLLPLLIPLIWRAPCRLDAGAFVEWLRAMAVDEVVERLAPYIAAGDWPTEPDVGVQRDRCVHILGLWHDHYFRRLDTEIIAGLDHDAIAWRRLLATMPPQDLVEEATRGVYLEPTPAVDSVLLIPQYHYCPWTIYHRFGRLKIYLYPADTSRVAPGDLPPDLMRTTRALSDESRMRILRFLATGAYSFTDVVRQTGLAKSTVHQHLGVLRAAGLVRVHDGGRHAGTYSLRPHTIQRLGDQLDAFLHPDRNALAVDKSFGCVSFE